MYFGTGAYDGKTCLMISIVAYLFIHLFSCQKIVTLMVNLQGKLSPCSKTLDDEKELVNGSKIIIWRPRIHVIAEMHLIPNLWNLFLLGSV